MAGQAFFTVRPDIRGLVRMASQTGQPLHPEAMDLLAFMAFQAEPVAGKELMESGLVFFYISVALGAFNLFNEYMFCMSGGFCNIRSGRKFIICFPVALETEFPWDNDLAVSFLYGRGFLEDSHQEHTVLFAGCGIVAFMTVDIAVGALLPRIVGRLHEVAADAEFGIVFREIVNMIGHGPAPDKDDQEQKDNDQTSL